MRFSAAPVSAQQAAAASRGHRNRLMCRLFPSSATILPVRSGFGCSCARTDVDEHDAAQRQRLRSCSLGLLATTGTLRSELYLRRAARLFPEMRILSPLEHPGGARMNQLGGKCPKLRRESGAPAAHQLIARLVNPAHLPRCAAHPSVRHALERAHARHPQPNAAERQEPASPTRRTCVPPPAWGGGPSLPHLPRALTPRPSPPPPPDHLDGHTHGMGTRPTPPTNTGRAPRRQTWSNRRTVPNPGGGAREHGGP